MSDLQNSPSLCPLPWLHLSANTDTSLRVCCNTDHGAYVLDENGKRIRLKSIVSVKEHFNTPFLREFRRKLLAGEKHDYCRGCYKVEENGGTSIRQVYLRQFADEMERAAQATAPDGAIDPKIRYIDFSLSNHCNLRCRMCGPGSSYLLKQDFEALSLPFSAAASEAAHKGWDLDEKFDQLVRELLPHAEEILTTGGEPFISKQHLHLAETAVKLGYSHQIVLRYHTNLTTFPERLTQLWRNFRKIEVHASIESAGELNDYIRQGSRWAHVIRNFERLIALKAELPLWIEVHSCFQAYNVFRIPELLDFLARYDDQIPAMPYFIWLSDPPQLAASVLPSHLRELAASRVERYLDLEGKRYERGPFRDFNQEKLNNLQSYLKALRNADFDPKLFERFVAYTNRLDRHRGQSLGSLVPELADSMGQGPAPQLSL